jgi:putative transposase
MAKTNKDSLSQWVKLLDLQDWTIKQSGRWLTNHLSHATKHLPDKEEFVFRVFKDCIVTLLLIKRIPKFKDKTLSMLGCLPKSKWTTFLDNLSTSNNHSMLTTQLLQILLQELTSRGKDCQPFWTPVCLTTSDKLLLPTGTDFVGLDSNSSTIWLQRQEGKSQFLTIKTIEQVNRNFPTTFSPSFMSSLAHKWEKEAIKVVKLKTLKVRIYPTHQQKTILDDMINTSRYVYNKALQHINDGHKINFNSLRDLLVTAETKKNLPEYKEFDSAIVALKATKKLLSTKEEKEEIERQIKVIQQQRRDTMKGYASAKNMQINAFELNTPKDVRSNAIERLCDAYKTGFTNLKKGNIKHFKMQFKKKSAPKQTLELTPKNIQIVSGRIKILPETFKDECFFEVSNNSKKRLENLKIKNNVDIVRFKGCYYLHLCVATEPQECKTKETVAGVDLGIRTFATVHSNNLNTKATFITEYKHCQDLLKRLNRKLCILKEYRRVRKKSFNKIEKRKGDLVDKLHWDFVNDILKKNDVVYLGDIKSHDIVKGGRNKHLNRAFNDLKFNQLKQRLIYKAGVLGKTVVLVKEHYTTKTCSSCGVINNNVGSKEVFCCEDCHLVTGRDMNACKNIKLKGFIL